MGQHLHRAVLPISILLAIAACSGESQPLPRQAAVPASAVPASAGPAPEPQKVIRDACQESGQPEEFCACLRDVQPRIMKQVQEKGAADPETMNAASACTGLMELPEMASDAEGT